MMEYLTQPVTSTRPLWWDVLYNICAIGNATIVMWVSWQVFKIAWREWRSRK